jgi:hypothetical protein
MTTAPSKPSPSEVSDKLPGMAANGVHSSIGVLIRSVSRPDVTTVVLDVVLSSLDLEALILSSSSFFLALSYVATRAICFVFVVSPLPILIFSGGRFVVRVFSIQLVSPWLPFSSSIGIFLQPLQLFLLVLLPFPSFSVLLTLSFLYL